MIKFVPEDTTVTFSEVPDEITLCIEISNCQNCCKGCHSPYLKNDIGSVLTYNVLDDLIKKNDGITCVCFMGEGKDPESLCNLINYVKDNYPELKIGLYSGRESVDEDFYWETLDYLKIGPYKEEFGPLNKETTNQKMYYKDRTLKEGNKFNRKEDGSWVDITEKFWRKTV